ncbi:hypothetical protein J4573_02305 [Actinomadura barringtoniae]|uniref:Methylamine utilisation protein MauE domain-containing protein n=1 Tax=Actinomadura barringtoniae TaxID=1427535 RepID=A0A939T0P9_9ACTN|nr:MauE/DoxX family redox-associated membrane protein [Actinomadura barringtoniae]MBO2445911.1 hypothetical protein [Actinomadura barringtoniae]
MLYLLSGLYAVLFVVFGVSAWSKLMRRDAFAESLRSVRLIPRRLVRQVAAVVTVAELVAALGLGWAGLAVIGAVPGGVIAELVSLALAGLLLSALTFGMTLAVRRGWEATCACFGSTERPLRGRHLVRNGLLLGVVLAGVATRSLAGEGTADLAGALVAMAGGAVVALLLIHVDDLVDLYAPARSAESASPTGS